MTLLQHISIQNFKIRAHEIRTGYKVRKQLYKKAISTLI